MNKVRILLVDDHEIVRKGLSSMLQDEPQFEVVGEASNGQEGLEKIRSLEPDLALIDIRMKEMSGPALCRTVRQENLKTILVILTSYADEALVQTCLQLGVQGYILKDIQGFDLVKSIRTIMQGESILDPKATKVAVKLIEQGIENSIHPRTLNPRDLDILRLMAEGLTNREIGEKMFLSENTIKTHVLDIFRRIGVKNRIEAVVTAYRQGIL
ncbi:response regulator [Ferviditalea candida]|uniref:Response regulator transcription factor n=1 Tax=Ferviditalea candida TaxID=3108399 RepID=A0ABU5ZJ88_9BACL|nr:response regulator transcription factor [Paenibacillaceae bacterium T2]